MADDASVIAAFVAEVIEDVRVVERLRSVLTSLQDATRAIGAVAEIDVTLGPELGVALGHIEDCGNATERALKFVQARFDTRYDHLQEREDS